MKVFALLLMAGFLSCTNFMCSGKPKYQDFTSDTTSNNYVRQCLTDISSLELITDSKVAVENSSRKKLYSEAYALITINMLVNFNQFEMDVRSLNLR